MIKRAELELAYWGPNKLPPEWNSVDEVASMLSVSAEYISKALVGYDIPVRTVAVNAHKEVWEVLETVFRMVPQSHFLYQTEINRKAVDFYIVKESVGIIVDSSLPNWEVKTIHIGNSMIVKIGCSDNEEMQIRLEQQLRGIGVRTKFAHDTEEDDGGW